MPYPRRIRDWGEHGSAVCVEKEDGALDERDREIAALRDRLSRCSPTIRGVAAPTKGESRAQHLLLRILNNRRPKNGTSAAVGSIVGYINATSVGVQSSG